MNENKNQMIMLSDVANWIDKKLNWVEGFLGATSTNPDKALEKIDEIREDLKTIVNCAGDVVVSYDCSP